ncbi:MAG TPA: WD40 repeat domain-containing protein [Ktedonobacteraceae bacterium]
MASRTSILVLRRILGLGEQRLVAMGYAGLDWMTKAEPPIRISLDGKEIGTIWPPKRGEGWLSLPGPPLEEERSQFEIQAGHHDLMLAVTWPSAMYYMAFTGVAPGIQSFNSAPGETVTFLCQYTPAIPRGYKFRLSRETPPQQKEQLPLRTLTGHRDPVLSVAFSPDGQTLASGSWDNTIKLWNLATGKELRTFTGHRDPVLSVAFSPDGQTLASGGLKDIKLWNLATGKELRALTGHTNHVDSVAFSPDGQTLASGSWDNTIKLWNLATGKELRTLTSHTGTVHSVAISPNGQTLVSGSGDKTIKVWDIASGKELRTLTGYRDSVLSVAFSPDGQILASGSGDNTIKIWGKK